MNCITSDILQLIFHLRQEKLFVDSEKNQLKDLNKQLGKAVEQLYHSSFVCGEQRRNYNDFLTRPHSSPPACCQRANLLMHLQFTDAYHALGENEYLFGSFINSLRNNPSLLANCLAIGEQNGLDICTISPLIFSSIYSNCLLPEDEKNCLQLLKNLIEIQLKPAENPRRLLHKSSCAFSLIYKSYIESLPQAKVFLTAALHQPIVQLLMEDELFLETDPLKAVSRFPNEERARRFGKEGTPEFEDALSRYKMWTIKKLVNITQRFIDNIKQAMCGFPHCLSWLVHTLYDTFIREKCIDAKEVSSLCIDLIFDLFLCSAVVTPEPYGIVEVPVSHISRFNLIQVAQILKTLAINRWEQPDVKLDDLHSSFDKETLSNVLDQIMEQNSNDVTPPVTPGRGPFMGISKASCLIPEKHLKILLNFFIKVEEKSPADSPVSKELNELLEPLQTHLPSFLSTPEEQAPTTPMGSPKKNLLSKVKVSRRGIKVGVEEDESNSLNESKESLHSKKEEDRNSFDYENVLVLNINPSEVEIPGFLTEEKVLSNFQSDSVKPSRVRMNIVEDGAVGGEVIEKRTRFSLSHDDGSIGNTSDNLEAISEAASNHSVASSLDDVEQVDQPDNLSDMVSANVSGRGTPNVSGRDTPSSMMEGDDPPQPPQPAEKPARDDIEEKFGRFEIKPIVAGDETVSLVSDTWSTDVLASDSETIEAAADENQFLDRHLQELDRMHNIRARFRHPEPEATSGEIFDTASEAWSTDVLASDSERLAELDTDAESVARSDDTGRSEGDVEMVNVERGAEPEQRPEPPRQVAVVEIQSESSTKAMPVMQVNGEKQDFTPIRTAEEEMAELDPMIRHVEPSGTQTLGRLSLNLSDLPHNGLLPAGQPLLQFVSDKSTQELPEKPEKKPIQIAPVPFETKPLQGATASIDSINLSTTSLVSSSSSGSDVSNQKNLLVVKEIRAHVALTACISAPATGAIPKSISFDKTAEKGDKEMYDGDNKHKKGFFKGFKIPGFKTRRKPGLREDLKCADGMRRAYSEDSRQGTEESSDDILEKYRNKGLENSTNNNVNFRNTEETKAPTEEVANDPQDTRSYAFKDAKRKLRKALSCADSWISSHNQSIMSRRSTRHTDVLTFLRMQLAEAQSIHDSAHVAQLHETLRCVQLLDEQTQNDLIQVLKEDYHKRSTYIGYLIRSRQQLLLSLSHMKQLQERVDADSDIVVRSLVSLCVRIFLEKRESQMGEFSENFTQMNTSDEKVSLVENFLSTLYSELERDPIWISSTPEQLNLAQITLERAIMSHIYLHALYPNGDGDVSRDQVLQKHINKLSEIITPNHKDLGIPKMYQYECPWPSAQAELSCLSAYKTAGDKLRCIVRTSQAIMNLLSMTHESSVPAADDFIPVFVYVIVKANPPSLLSTIQYVNLFYENRLEGEEHYWWTQFCAAVEFIKTMDYTV